MLHASLSLVQLHVAEARSTRIVDIGHSESRAARTVDTRTLVGQSIIQDLEGRAKAAR
jgi:hypothetical protein